MKKKDIFIALWYLSILSLIISLCLFAMCFIKYWSEEYSIPFAVFTLIFALSYSISYKPLKCDNGHTLIQAAKYFRTCKQNGFKESYSDKDRRILTSVAEEMEILAESEISEKMRFYDEGKSIVDNMKNPVINKLWKIQDRYFNKKKQKKAGKKQ